MPLDKIAMCIKKECVACGKIYKPHRESQKFCSESCKRKNNKENYIEKYSKSTLNHLNVGKIGAVSELEMCAYYVREGYEVFRNVTPNGPADIILWKPETGELHILDIKSYVSTCAPDNYIVQEERKRDFKVKIVPYDYNCRMPLRALSEDLGGHPSGLRVSNH